MTNKERKIIKKVANMVFSLPNEELRCRLKKHNKGNVIRLKNYFKDMNVGRKIGIIMQERVNKD